MDAQRQAQVDGQRGDEPALEGLHGVSLRRRGHAGRSLRLAAAATIDCLSSPTMLSVKISTKHQIAVPSEARKKLGLKAGDRLDVEIEGDVIHLRRHVPAGTRLLGIGAHLYDGTDAAERIRALRDEWEARQLEREAQVARDIAAAWTAARRSRARDEPIRSMTIDELLARHRRLAIDANAFIYLFEAPGPLAPRHAAPCSMRPRRAA